MSIAPKRSSKLNGNVVSTFPRVTLTIPHIPRNAKWVDRIEAIMSHWNYSKTVTEENFVLIMNGLSKSPKNLDMKKTIFHIFLKP